MILLIDNYDSFVFNIARYIEELGFSASVVRNNHLTLAQIEHLKPSHIVISPGPCTPNEAGISLEVIRELAASVPILGICLGHQAIGQVYGANISRAKRPMHGKASLINHNSQGIFKGLPPSFKVGRYHSLIVPKQNLSSEIQITSHCELGEIMSLQHVTLHLHGLQFHPESVLTEHGYALIQNFLTLQY
jgi:anthranilate synthase/aminodeoxychorismate synthase-like glutamine amidotransferase